MGLKLEAGKRYVTRAGWITPAIEEDLEARHDDSMRFFCGDASWSVEGRVFYSGEDSEDLVAEFVEVAPLPDVSDTDDQLVGNLMFEIGGQFVASLARAYQFADPSNRQKIRNTFREYWSHYFALAQQEKAKSNG